MALRVYAEKRYNDDKEIAWKKDIEGQNNHKKIYGELYDLVKKELKSINYYPIELIFKNPNCGDRESTLFYIYPSEEVLKSISEGERKIINAIRKINEVALTVINNYSNQHSLEH